MALASKVNKIPARVLLKNAKDGFKKGNFLCSPMSLETMLSMVSWGAQGQTLKQLLGFLGTKGLNDLCVQSPSLKFFNQLVSSEIKKGAKTRGPAISIANGVWVDHRFSLVPSYQETLKNIYKAQVSSVDFGYPDEAARKINSWAKENTKGLIKEIVKPDDFDIDTMTVLGNSLYFKGSWEEAFIKSETTNRKFHLINGETVTVPFITSGKRYLYGRHKGIKILEVPYECGLNSEQFTMYFFLPKAKDGFRNMIEEFDSDSGLFQKDFDLQYVPFKELWIPKFKMSHQFEPSDDLKEMGLTLPFHPLNQELKGILDHPGGELFGISNIIQKSVIEVDEKGTEAAAVTINRLVGSCRPASRPSTSFVADRPFLFMIREKISHAALFIGAVLNPKQDS